MGRSILIFCQNENKISFQEIIQFIRDGIYFEEDPEFGIHEDYIIIQYDSNFKPIVIREINNSKLVEDIKTERYEEIVEISSSMSICDKGTRDMILSSILMSKDIYRIEFSYDDLSEECWAMKACVESFLATEKNGIILANEGVYDSNVKLIMSFL